MRQLRGGFTTGTCAAAAARAAALVMTGGEVGSEVDVALLDGTRVRLPILYARRTGSRGAEAAVRKDAGDDPDVTHGASIVVTLDPADGPIGFRAGEGVGTVTRPGLALAPGEPAINPCPRTQIEAAIREATPRGVTVTISIPGGEALAERTHNARLGVVGGLSILGTSGRVRPYSCKACFESVRCAMRVTAASGIRNPVLVPGHIGERAARAGLRVGPDQIVEVGNDWGRSLDVAADFPFECLLALGHPGKLVKLVAGEWNTHSGASRSAAPYVAAVAERLHPLPLEAPATVEGILAAFEPAVRRNLSDVLAQEVRAAIVSRLQAPVKRAGQAAVAVALINLAGEIVGTSGDMTPWQ